MKAFKPQGFLYRLMLRWFICSLGLWIAAGLLRGSISYQDELAVIVVAGGLLALLNAVLKPVLVILSLPAILISLGFFMIVINGVTVYLVSKLYGAFAISGFGTAMLVGIVIGLVNYLVTAILERR